MAAIHLSFDTSAAHCAAALLWSDEQRVEAISEPMAKGQAERLLPMIDDLLAAHRVGWADLTAVCVGTGPGNFTGIRIAVSLARGLALGLGIPSIGVTGFQAASHAAGLHIPHWVLIDAPRGQIYVQRFDPLPGLPQIVDPDAGFDAPQVRMSDLTAEHLVRAVAEVGAQLARTGQPRPAPFYLRGADAAPSSDPPPVILP